MKAIFVTGAASGIGRATSLLFARRGFDVGCYDIDIEGARQVAQEIDALEPKAVDVGVLPARRLEPGKSSCRHGHLDVTNEQSWASALADFDQHAHRLDVLFNCAGILRTGPFEDVSPEDCKKQLDVNVMGIILGIQKGLPFLEHTARAHGASAIVNMSSVSAIYGQPELAVYSATKFAVRALTEALDVELRPRNIRVCDIMPGYVDTPMVHTQSYTPRSLARFGIKLSAEDVAEVVWKAAHGRGLHYVPQKQFAVLARMGGLLPEIGRVVMRRLAKR